MRRRNAQGSTNLSVIPGEHTNRRNQKEEETKGTTKEKQQPQLQDVGIGTSGPDVLDETTTATIFGRSVISTLYYYYYYYYYY